MSDIDFMYDFKYVIGTLAQALTLSGDAVADAPSP